MSGNDYGRIGNAAWAMLVLMPILCVIFVPLGLWKLVEIIIWILK